MPASARNLCRNVFSTDRAARTSLSTAQPVEPWFRDGILQAVPNLRAFAISLTSNPDRADDLVQDTIMRAWDKRASPPGPI